MTSHSENTKQSLNFMMKASNMKQVVETKATISIIEVKHVPNMLETWKEPISFVETSKIFNILS